MDNVLEELFLHQNEDGSFLDGDRFYTDKYRGTVWNLIIMAELGCYRSDPRVEKACEFVLSKSYDKFSGGFSVSYSKKYDGGLPSKVIPCLTGNMVYALIKMGYFDDERVQNAIDWIVTYQRTDDGVYTTSVDNKYKNLKACFSKHSCFMGVVKNLKALAVIKEELRTTQVKNKIKELSEFLLLHHIYKKSSDYSKISKPGWLKFGFPIMYQTDILEIVGIFMNLNIKDPRLQMAINHIASKSVKGEWLLETTFNDKMLVNIGKKNKPLSYITDRANDILEYYK